MVKFSNIRKRKNKTFIKRHLQECIFGERTKQQQEIDFVEEKDRTIYGFEFKWKTKPKIRLPKTFVKTYNAETKVIYRNNFREFVTV